MKTILLLTMAAGFSWASTINMQQLLAQTQEEHPAFKAAQEAIKSKHHMHQAESMTAPLTLHGTLANASPAFADNTVEYSLGIEKEFRIGDSAYYASQMGHYEHEAMEVVARRELLMLQNELKMHYHLSCIDKETIENYRKLYAKFDTVYEKKRKAFDYGELSKKELLQLELEKEQLQHKIDLLSINERSMRRKLLQKARLNGDAELQCHDLVPLEPMTLHSDADYAFSKQMYSNLEYSSDNAMKRYKSSFESLSLALHYDNELDMERIGISLSVPLTFTSNKNEKMRLSSLHEKQKISYEKEAFFHTKELHASSLKTSLNTLLHEHATTQKRLHKYENELMPLVEKSYRLNESSLIEYLLSYENFNEISETLNQTKKAYYQTLFELYNVLEIKE